MILRQPVRKGTSLLEVIVATAIFVLAIAALGSLVDLSSDQAQIVKQRSLAMQICKTKMNEVSAGIIPMTGVQENLLEGEDIPEGNPDWEWSLAVTDAPNVSVEGLSQVTVTVSWPDRKGVMRSESLTQIVMDVTIRGNNADAANIEGDDDESDLPQDSGTGTTGN